MKIIHQYQISDILDHEDCFSLSKSKLYIKLLDIYIFLQGDTWLHKFIMQVIYFKAIICHSVLPKLMTNITQTPLKHSDINEFTKLNKTGFTFVILTMNNKNVLRSNLDYQKLVKECVTERVFWHVWSQYVQICDVNSIIFSCPTTVHHCQTIFSSHSELCMSTQHFKWRTNKTCVKILKWLQSWIQSCNTSSQISVSM